MRQTGVTLTVSQLNEYIKALLDSNELLNDIYIKGEISNFTHHYKSGHLYFSLKDATGVLKAVMFRSSAQRLHFMPEDGMKVLVRGHVSVFPRDGVYQLYAEDIQPDGIGSLYLAFEQLKEKLAGEGLFDVEHKMPLPRFPEKIGIITADTGAAVADMKNILTRRFPMAELWIYPSLVQGASAPGELCAGLRFFNSRFPVDVIIIGRGGGSLEDLWAFNSEMLAREIYSSHIPVISAVGHETDFTICDFVADLRAPTPSAAAELAVPDAKELYRSLEHKKNLMALCIRQKEAGLRLRLDGLQKKEVFTNPGCFTRRLRERITELQKQLDSSMSAKLSDARKDWRLRAARLEALSPLAVMARGYSLVTDSTGTLIKSVLSVSKGQTLHIRFYDGSITAVTQTEKGDDTHARREKE